MMTSILYGVPCGYHCRRAPRHAFVEIFEVLWSDGPPDLLCDFDDFRHGGSWGVSYEGFWQGGSSPAVWGRPWRSTRPQVLLRHLTVSSAVEAFRSARQSFSSIASCIGFDPFGRPLPSSLLMLPVSFQRRTTDIFPRPKCICIFKTLSFLNE